MPLFYQHNINENTRLGIWRIEEPESFFLQTVPLKRDVSHPHKRLQHLAGRYLLPFLFDDFPLDEILIADTRKPFLENEKYHFSISHCGDFAAAMVSNKNRVGVDVEIVTAKIKRISHKFLSPKESGIMHHGWPLPNEKPAIPDFTKETLVWSSKEAIFKWYGLGGIDFIRDIQLNSLIQTGHIDEWILPFVFKKSRPVLLSIHARTFDQLVLAWVLT